MCPGYVPALRPAMGPPPRGTVAYRIYLDKKNAKARAVRFECRKDVARAFVADEI